MSNERVRSQTVVFLRHGVAEHNFRGAQLSSPELFDPSLTYDGKLSAVQAGEKIKRWWEKSQGGGKIDVILCSPLSRTLQTASLAFLPGAQYDEQPVNILCTENVREAFGMHYPDKRRERSVLVEHWPNVHFDEFMSENDEYWSPNQRETWEDVGGRVSSFLSWLCQRKEGNVVVVSHGVWIETCLKIYSPGALGDRRVYNCDAYSSKLLSRNGKLLSLSDVKLIS